MTPDELKTLAVAIHNTAKHLVETAKQLQSGKITPVVAAATARSSYANIRRARPACLQPPTYTALADHIGERMHCTLVDGGVAEGWIERATESVVWLRQRKTPAFQVPFARIEFFTFPKNNHCNPKNNQ